MQAGQQRGDAGGDDGAPSRPSDRLELEVALLSAQSPSSSGEEVRARATLVLVAVSDVDISDYIKQCLRGRPDIGIVEIRPADGPFDAARRLAVDLLITDAVGETTNVELRDIAVLFTGTEATDGLPIGEGRRSAFLLQPFNARRLLEAIGGLIVEDELER